jgi:hypothetical protein
MWLQIDLFHARAERPTDSPTAASLSACSVVDILGGITPGVSNTYTRGLSQTAKAEMCRVSPGFASTFVTSVSILVGLLVSLFVCLLAFEVKRRKKKIKKIENM